MEVDQEDQVGQAGRDGLYHWSARAGRDGGAGRRDLQGGYQIPEGNGDLVLEIWR